MMMQRFFLMLALLMPFWAVANLAVVANAPAQVRLRIGVTGATITTATVTVAGANVGSGTVQLTTALASARTGSSCATANFVFINAEGRAAPAGSRTISLTANSTAGLSCTTPATCGADNIPFTQIGWVNTPPAGYNPATIPNGTFNGSAAQPIISFPNSNQSQDCLRFQYVNTNIVRQGTYTGDVIFTLTMP